MNWKNKYSLTKFGTFSHYRLEDVFFSLLKHKQNRKLKNTYLGIYVFVFFFICLKLWIPVFVNYSSKDVLICIWRMDDNFFLSHRTCFQSFRKKRNKRSSLWANNCNFNLFFLNFLHMLCLFYFINKSIFIMVFNNNKIILFIFSVRK